MDVDSSVLRNGFTTIVKCDAWHYIITVLTRIDTDLTKPFRCYDPIAQEYIIIDPDDYIEIKKTTEFFP